ncbi:YgjV family protein [Shewanella sp. KX20019]|uniref:YgjV family protein n=1 Tax=Shewanella sp. KX20019 TaxID=2803864 RepID=UPI0019272D05|nr:YgjV family protein [Shewanella sp. KX20019]QQX79410.1 YgjV family protein [Shewanella sp. KX20019]
MSAFMLSQCLISIAIVFDILSFQFKQKQKIVACLCVSGVLISSHFALLEQWTATALMLLATMRYYVSIFSHSKRLMCIFLSLNTLVLAYTFSGVLSLLSFTGSSVQTMAAFCHSDLRLRQLMLIGTSIWLINNALLGSPAAVVMELLFISSNLIAYYRYYGLAFTDDKITDKKVAQ